MYKEALLNQFGSVYGEDALNAVIERAAQELTDDLVKTAYRTNDPVYLNPNLEPSHTIRALEASPGLMERDHRIKPGPESAPVPKGSVADKITGKAREVRDAVTQFSRNEAPAAISNIKGRTGEIGEIIKNRALETGDYVSELAKDNPAVAAALAAGTGLAGAGLLGRGVAKAIKKRKLPKEAMEAISEEIMEEILKES